MIDVLLAMGAGGQAGAGSQGGGNGMLIVMGAMFVIFYFLLIRPQQKKQKEHRAMLDALKKGDKIISSGGLIGVITGVSDNELTIEISPKVRVKISRGYVAGKMDK